MFTKVLAVEWAGHNIRVNAVAPAYIWTELHERLVGSGLRSQEEVDRITRRVPMKKWGKPEDVADVIVFLASDASRYVAGETIWIDGRTS